MDLGYGQCVTPWHRGVLAGAAALALAGSVVACSGAGATTTMAAPSATSAAAGPALRPKGETIADVPIVRVVDGDTVHVLVSGQETTVRLVGINTPETVKPDSPIECFGPEASAYAKKMLTDRQVTLEFDASQGRTDQYGRTLAYVWRQLPEGGLRLFNLEAVAGGYAQERQYGPTPYAWKNAFRSAQASARKGNLGMWGACR